MTFFNVPPKHKLLSFTLALIVVFCCFSGYAADNPGERFLNALTCFSNKFIYSGCNEAYRLNESGNLNVPPDALDLFCHGPCLAETQQVLKCADSLLSTFIFNNKATLPDINNSTLEWSHKDGRSDKDATQVRTPTPDRSPNAAKISTDEQCVSDEDSCSTQSEMDEH